MSSAPTPSPRTWEAASPRGLVVFAHPSGEPAARHDYAARRLTEGFYGVVALEHPDAGEPRGRGGMKTAVAELDQLVSSHAETYPGRPVFLLGHSTGSAAALGYAIAHQHRLTGLILSAPLAQVAPGRLQAMFTATAATLLPDAPVMHLDPERTDPDSRTIADYIVDPLTQLGPISASTHAEEARRTARLMDGIDTITLATLLLWGTQEGLSPSGGAEHLLGALTHADLTRHTFNSQYHALLDGPERDAVLDTIIIWLDAHV